MGTSWSVGDFGRFEIESPKFPRFEVISATKTEVEVWYSGSTHTKVIPKQTFLDDCVRWWDVELVDEPLPKWLYPGGSFTLESPTGVIQVTLAQIPSMALKDRYVSRLDSIHGVDVKGRTLTFRRKQGDHISCLTGDPQTLLLIPFKTVLKYGRSRMTRWDFMRTRDIVEPDEDDFY